MKTLTPFKQSFLGTLAAFLFIAGIFAAGVIFAQSGYDPNRDVNADGQIDTVDIQEVASSWNTAGSPRGTLTVFASTTVITDVTTVGGRIGMGRICLGEDPVSHFCTVQEVEAALRTVGVVFQDSFTSTSSWLDSIVDPPYRDWSHGNCQGWTSSGDDSAYIITQDGQLQLRNCHPAYGTASVACCK